jgi:hypothetical protein
MFQLSDPEDYLYSNAKNYAGEQGLLTVTIPELLLPVLP